MNLPGKEGTIIKGYSGFYYVLSEGTIFTCSLRGKFRQKKMEQTFLPGDRVVISLLEGDKGVIEEVLPRKNELLRPTIANVDQALLVFSLTSPDPDFALIDRLLLFTIEEQIEPILIWTKSDLATEECIEKAKESFVQGQIKQVIVSAETMNGIEAVKNLLRQRITVLAGPSGAGKSSLLNALQPGLALKTGEVSKKTGRGRHTTRHVELLHLSFDALVADTPGFSTLNLPALTAPQLGELFPEIVDLMGQCRFNSCLHRTEPDCAVQEAVEKGLIHQRRYESYLLFLEELINQDRRKPKGRKE
ncbi:ribosome small subunit-dependent GTPase A [Heliorestis acidaminivorans]|uniref:Small ribosomal subunit biogenesis GTPase RsgA n=1 Tax=Heliorestis acidaminivorans TaxID=553427 RepID=A0A6I0F6L3_9FIRM|nr:ribosome small subunit-dependent GTPase A [Heliorestis acidaminivorans]KAB2954467.1 ribosome small subunit-dependent GTPase A [Heliorestis acidaminivorans]